MILMMTLMIIMIFTLTTGKLKSTKTNFALKLIDPTSITVLVLLTWMIVTKRDITVLIHVDAL